MERRNNLERNWSYLFGAGAALLVASAGHASPINAGQPSRAMGDHVSIGAFHSDTASSSSRARAIISEATQESPSVDIPWAILPVSDIEIPIASPDWRAMPKKIVRGPDGRASIRRVSVSASLSALRGDAPVAPGSVFSTSYGDEPPTDVSTGASHLDDAGNPVFAAPTKYFQDFEDGTVAREWQLAGLGDMEKFGHFAGPYRNSTQTLYVQCEPNTPYVVTFDLLFIAAQLGDPEASDMFSVEVDGQALLEDTFVTLRERNEKFNAEREDFDADIYKQVAVTFTPRGDGVAKIKFRSAAHGAPGGETWGLDNVHIDIAPKQTLGELDHAEPGDFGGLGELAGFGGSSQPFDNGVNYFRGDPSIRPPGPRGPIIPPAPIPVPSPGAGVLLAASACLGVRRRR